MNVYQFPEDLGSQQQGHYMIIKSLSPLTSIRRNNTATGGAPGPAEQYTDAFLFFVPHGPENGQAMVWQQSHEYTDIKLARLFTNALGVVGEAMAGAFTLMGHPINPRVDVLYRNTNLREYQFTFMLAPQTKRESATMKDMIKRIRYCAAPDISLANQLMDPPQEFTIDFYYVDANGALQRNENIPRIAQGVIKRVDVDYTPNGQWSTFYDGSPVSALLTIMFMETKIIDKTFIDKGF